MKKASFVCFAILLLAAAAAAVESSGAGTIDGRGDEDCPRGMDHRPDRTRGDRRPAQEF